MQNSGSAVHIIKLRVPGITCRGWPALLVSPPPSFTTDMSDRAWAKEDPKTSVAGGWQNSPQNERQDLRHTSMPSVHYDRSGDTSEHCLNYYIE